MASLSRIVPKKNSRRRTGTQHCLWSVHVQLQIIQSRQSHCSKKKFVGFFLQYTHSMTRVFSVAMFNFCAGISDEVPFAWTQHWNQPQPKSLVHYEITYTTILHFRCCVPSNFATISRATAVSIL